MYPPKISIEQTSSQSTAKYKADIINGKTIADITGGFGVDSYYFSEKFKTVHHFEIDKKLSKIVSHNYNVLGKKNISCFSEEGILASTKQKYDIIYADPSRRNKEKGKVFFLKDCEPNIPKHIDLLLNQCNTLLLKTSPMLDISVGIKELLYVSEIHIVAIKNEVKELIWFVKKNHEKDILIKTLNILKTKKQEFSFTYGKTEEISYSAPKKYVYEPNAAILKSGAFNLLVKKYKVEKLNPHTHLYTHDCLVDFPGRVFSIEKVVPYSKKEIKKVLPINKANISTRNFPESVEVLRKKWKIKDGGQIYLFFTTLENQKRVLLICSRLKDS